MEWKEDSLEMMVCGSQYTDTVAVQIGSRTVPFEIVDSLNMLGYQIPRTFTSTRQDVQGRVQQARRAFFAQVQHFTCKALPLVKEFRRCQSTVQSRLLYAAEAITIDSGCVRVIHAFEGMCLPRMSGRRKPGDMGWEVWRPAALTRVRSLFCDGGFPSAVQMLCWKSW
eukprot:9335100-Pyramimonas_sp.AAC.1